MKPTQHPESAQCIYRDKRAKACREGIIILFLSSDAGCSREGAGGVARKRRLQVGRGSAHSMPESASALWRIVSLTAAKTRRIFEVSVAWVKLQNCDVSMTVRKKQLV